ncbi:MAG: hypothetical protein AAF281_14835, partial [Pseudomonadota bacterium]
SLAGLHLAALPPLAGRVWAALRLWRVLLMCALALAFATLDRTLLATGGDGVRALLGLGAGAAMILPVLPLLRRL